MSDAKLMSVAQIARAIDAPESTVHYWKHRFAQHLPSRGRGRQMRFTPEAVEVFGLIKERMRAGHPAEAIAAELAQLYPLTPDTRPAPIAGAISGAAQSASSLELAREIGREMAGVLAETLGRVLSGGTGLDPKALAEAAQGVTDDLSARLSAHEDKISVLEAELVRLRKDRREMERYLLDKIEKMNS